jgi:hypothetical protein
MPDESQEPLESELAAGPAESEINPEEIKSVKEVMGQLAKTAKTLKLYLPNNPIYQKFLQDLYDRIAGHIEAYGDLRLRIKQYQMVYQGEVVYENMTSLESLAFKFYVDGLRDLTLMEGLELEELTEFIEIISRKYDPDDPDDDIVTLLWDRRLPHIKYLVSEDFIQESDQVPMKENPEGVQEMMRDQTQFTLPSTIDTTAVVNQALGIKLRDQTLGAIFTLAEDEVARIRQEMSRDEDINPIAILLNILLEILRIDITDGGFQESADLLDSVFETLLRRGDLKYAIRIIRAYNELLAPGSDVSEARNVILRASLEKASSPGMIEAFGAILERSEQIDADQVLAFCLLLGKQAVLPLVDLMGKEERAKIRRTLCEGLVQICRGNIEPLYRGLKDPRWFVARNVLYVIGRIGNPDSLEKLRPLVSHKEVRVRKELIHTLDTFRDDRARDMVLDLVEDPDSSIRTQALRSLASEHHDPALDTLLNLVHRKSFLQYDAREKMEWFRALGQIGGNEMIPLFQRLLGRGMRAWFNKTAHEETALAAVEGLRRIGTPEAQGVIMSGQKTSRKRIREACQRATRDSGKDADGR